MSEIPVVDLLDSEEAIVQRLREACLGYGFFYLKGHGISQDQMDLVLAMAKDFFGQSDEVKGKVGPGTAGPEFRGYSPWRAIALDPKWQKGGDTREQFTIGREVAMDSAEARNWPSVLGPNKWPASSEKFDGEQFQKVMSDYYGAVESLGSRILPFLSKSMGAENDELTPLFAPAHVSSPIHCCRYNLSPDPHPPKLLSSPRSALKLWTGDHEPEPLCSDTIRSSCWPPRLRGPHRLRSTYLPPH
jgi:isopenicillin N synthase-like dioxygenase